MDLVITLTWFLNGFLLYLVFVFLKPARDYCRTRRRKKREKRRYYEAIYGLKVLGVILLLLVCDYC